MVPREEWPALKKSGKFEYEQIPALEINDQVYVQSLAIERLLAKKFNLMGKPEQEYEINNIIDSVEDLWKALMPFSYPANDEMKKDSEKFKQAFIDQLKKFLKIYQKKYEKHGKKKYLLGDELTLADIHLVTVLSTFAGVVFGGKCIVKDEAPLLGELFCRLKENELKEYFEKDFIPA